MQTASLARRVRRAASLRSGAGSVRVTRDAGGGRAPKAPRRRQYERLQAGRRTALFLHLQGCDAVLARAVAPATGRGSQRFPPARGFLRDSDGKADGRWPVWPVHSRVDSCEWAENRTGAAATPKNANAVSQVSVAEGHFTSARPRTDAALLPFSIFCSPRLFVSFRVPELQKEMGNRGPFSATQPLTNAIPGEAGQA